MGSIPIPGRVGPAEATSTPITQSDFGEIITGPVTPFLQASAVGGILPRGWGSRVTSGGTGGVDGNQFKVSTGTGGGSGYIFSNRANNYKPGEMGIARFTAVFPNGGVIGAEQGAGLKSLGDELGVGFLDNDFGMWHRHGGAPEVQTLTISAHATGSENAAVTVDGTLYAVPLTDASAKPVPVNFTAAEVAEYLNSNATGWTAQQNADTVVLVAETTGDKTGAFSFSSGTAIGSFAETFAGVDTVSDFHPQVDWNMNKAEWINPRKGNIFVTYYRYLGFGGPKLWAVVPRKGPVLLHQVPWENEQTETVFGNPSLQAGYYATSTGSSEDVVVKGGSFLAGVVGVRSLTDNPRATNAEQAGVGTTLLNILSIRNRKVLAGRLNRQELDALTLSISNDTSGGTGKIATFELLLNPNFSGPPVFQDVEGDANGLAEKDSTLQTFTGGKRLGSWLVAPGQSREVFLKDLGIRLTPSDVLCVAGRANAGGSGISLSATLGWYEDM